MALTSINICISMLPMYVTFIMYMSNSMQFFGAQLFTCACIFQMCLQFPSPHRIFFGILEENAITDLDASLDSSPPPE